MNLDKKKYKLWTVFLSVVAVAIAVAIAVVPVQPKHSKKKK